MATEAAKSEAKAKKAKKAYATVLVAIPGWPAVDPDRPMIHSIRPSAPKARRAVKRLSKMLPQYIWSYEMLTATEAREVKLKPFRLEGNWLAGPVEVQFTTRSVKVVPV